MRKHLLLLLLMIRSSISYGETEIPLSDEACNIQDFHQETRTTSFSAQLITNNLVKVQSTDITTFEVRILEAEDNTVCYEGSTTHGILHITTSSLSAGHYILNIKGDGFKYVGEFVIGN